MDSIFCFDLDGTISKTEILPMIAKEVDIFEEIEALTDATIKGIIPFNRSFQLRVKLLSEIPIKRIQDLVMDIPLHNEIVNFIKRNSANSYVITGNLDVWIEELILKKIGCNYFSSRAESSNNQTKGISSILNKGTAIKELKQLHKNHRIVSIGDGMGDVPMHLEADIRIAFGAVHPPIETLINVSDYIIYEEKALCRLLNTLL